MNNPLNPVYKPGPSGDNNSENSSKNTSNESSPKGQKLTPKKTARRKLVFKDPANEVPKLTIDRHKMKIVCKSIPETANLDELERKISLENILIDTGDLMSEDIPQRNGDTLK